MPLPSSGTLTLNDIQNEFGGSNPISLSEYYRGGSFVISSDRNALIPTSGAISISNFYGSSSRSTIEVVITASTSNFDVYSVVSSNPQYFPGKTDVNVSINNGVSLGSSSTDTYALSVPSQFSPTDTVTILNQGTILGAGGNGGNGGSATRRFPPANPTVTAGTPGLGGGSAIYVNRPTTITNLNVISGGGGGGGGSGGRIDGGPVTRVFAGAGGGGGLGYSVAGSGGTAGTATNPLGPVTGASPGSSGTSSSGGSGGSPGGGPGGGYGAAGSAGSAGTGGTGGAAGNYIVGNAFVTWPATGTRYGGVA